MSNDRDHWEALAEELGLPSKSKKSEPVEAPPSVARPPTESPPTPPPAPSLEVAETIAEKPSQELPPAPPEPRRVKKTEEAASAEAVAPAEEHPVSLPAILNLDQPILDPMIEGPSPDRLPESDLFPEEPSVPEPERPRGRGGRRGQRGNRGGRAERAEPEAAPARGEEPAAETAKEDRSRRRRGRGRPQPEPEPEPDDILADEEPIEAEEEEDFDDGPEDNLADLNVPSWAEIIGSLYRPER